VSLKNNKSTHHQREESLSIAVRVHEHHRSGLDFRADLRHPALSTGLAEQSAEYQQGDRQSKTGQAAE
jgi:hypothetical protein